MKTESARLGIKTKTNTLLGAVLFLLVIGGAALALPPNHPAVAGLTFANRVAYQSAIEDVYWRHRIWPDTNADPKPSLDEVMSQAEIEKKVEDYLRNSQALEDYWQQPITAEQLQAEMERMASDTKQPEVLRELFETLGNDPFVIAECLARPVLTERLIADLSAQDETGRLESLRTAQLRSASGATMSGQVAYTVPDIPASGCTDDTWTPTTVTNAPDARSAPAVWTGSEVIVWGGSAGIPPSVYFNTGGRYNPSTDSWKATSTTNAPAARNAHKAVWTGIEMVVWGGRDGTIYLNTGGRYNPGTDSWTATSTTNAPEARQSHSTVWSGSEMIVWGGEDNALVLNNGGRYNPSTDSWTATSTTNAPSARVGGASVWTGSEMIVWGGMDLFNNSLNTGGRYNPSTDSWTSTSLMNAPVARRNHNRVWTGSEMIVWGGYDGISYLNSGGRYNPATDTWAATSTVNAPTARNAPPAVWTGSEMIVWGSISTLDTDGRYNPNTDSWTATSTTNAPTARAQHTAVWTGSEMIVWGGVTTGPTYLNTGGRYCAAAPIPTPTPTPTPTPAPTPAAPTALKATNVTATSFTANWSSVSGATDYRLDVAANSSFTTYLPGYQGLDVGNTTSRSVTGLAANTFYYYRVRAYNGSGTSPNSNVITVKTKPH